MIRFEIGIWEGGERIGQTDRQTDKQTDRIFVNFNIDSGKVRLKSPYEVLMFGPVYK